MTLNEWAARSKRSIFDDLLRGYEPGEGSFDHALLKDAKTKGLPQMGTTVFFPQGARFEYVYSDTGSTIVFSVTVTSPERIVFMPVPSWVVESIWQGEIDGSFHFEGQARQLMAELEGELAAEANARLFGPKAPTRRE